jgi:hypothetical protein
MLIGWSHGGVRRQMSLILNFRSDKTMANNKTIVELLVASMEIMPKDRLELSEGCPLLLDSACRKIFGRNAFVLGDWPVQGGIHLCVDAIQITYGYVTP